MSPHRSPVSNHDRLDAVFRADPYLSRLGVDLDHWHGGNAVVRWTPGPGDCNFVGSVHGGALFSLADAALGVASNSWGRICVALSIEAQFLLAVQAGEPLVATAIERSRTRRTAAYGIEVVSDGDGTLRAAFQALAFRTGRWHLGAEAWPEDWRADH
jgi:acyl-CoA thioesterase